MALEIRKIESKEEAERKSRRNTLILSIIMIAILVLSTVGYFSMREGSNSGTNKGNGKVQNVGAYWVINYGGNSIQLSNSPESTKNTSMLAFKTIEDYAGKTVYIASDYAGGTSEISSAMQNYAERVQSACYGKCNKNLPERNCTDIMIVVSDVGNKSVNSKVYEQDNCVFIEGDLRAVDAFLYRLFGVN